MLFTHDQSAQSLLDLSELKSFYLILLVQCYDFVDISLVCA